MPQFQARLPHVPIPDGDGAPLLAFQKADRLKTAKGHRTSFDEAGAGQRSLALNRKEVAAAEMLQARAPSPHAQLRHYNPAQTWFRSWSSKGWG